MKSIVAIFGVVVGLSLFLVSSVAFADSDLQGRWDGKDYRISMSENFEYLRGNWGDANIDFNVSKTWQYIRGVSASGSVDLSFSQTWTYVRGSTSVARFAAATSRYRYLLMILQQTWLAI